MGWTIEFTATAARQFEKLARSAQVAIDRFLRSRLRNAVDPRQFGKPLRGEKKGLWRYRVGDYRLICDLQDDKVVVLVLEVGHRKDIHR